MEVTIGSSDVPVILGISRYQNVWELWPRLVGLKKRYDDDDAPHMATGRITEKYVIPPLFRDREGVDLVPGPPISEPGVPGPEPWMHARHDFTRADDGRVVEAKKLRSWDVWGPDGTDRAPADYLAQLMWIQRVVSPQPAQLAAFNVFDERFRIYEVGWRDEVAEQLVGTVRNWYERHVLEVVPPDLDSSAACSRNLALIYPGRRVKLWRNPEPEDLALARDLHRVRVQMAELEVESRELEVRLKGRINDDYGIRGVARWSSRGKKEGRAFTLLYQPEETDE